ncbi:mitochondrial cell division protein [Tieghemostelium lacteum]|uniref:Mitochondrial cell division protein n=1 Tax=Tieghemostelium lacteum TaxID=361077 RepID=A0A151Z865_TIELA|nr:mitochondrial cell division protein [Tieghemostelium lacteum]|eukprot:KYQ90163.1 mitochondrial cell division protein [Tieghemostelium lacteum]
MIKRSGTIIFQNLHKTHQHLKIQKRDYITINSIFRLFGNSSVLNDDTSTSQQQQQSKIKNYKLELFKPKISIVGVGGGGGNAINHMIEQQQLSEVEFYAFNTDRQDLNKSKSINKIQLGPLLTRGEGAGASPDKGRKAAEESRELIKHTLADTDLLFLACGLGGGTGTGSSPIIAQTIKQLNKNTIIVAVVTVPFAFEGKRKQDIAKKGLEELGKYVDTLVCISNENLLHYTGKETQLLEAFLYVDEILHSGIKSITNIIHTPGMINLDYSDLVHILQNRKGLSRIGFGEASGEDRAYRAVYDALNNPLVERDNNTQKFTGLLVNISGGSDVTLKEINRITTFLQENTDPDVQIFVGHCIDESLQGNIRIFALFVQ